MKKDIKTMHETGVYKLAKEINDVWQGEMKNFTKFFRHNAAARVTILIEELITDYYYAYEKHTDNHFKQNIIKQCRILKFKLDSCYSSEYISRTILVSLSKKLQMITDQTNRWIKACEHV